MKKFALSFLAITVAVLFITSCGVLGKRHSHEWGEWKVQSEADCAKDGVEVRECECGEQETRSIARK